jgi:acylphosphatase
MGGLRIGVHETAPLSCENCTVQMFASIIANAQRRRQRKASNRRSIDIITATQQRAPIMQPLTRRLVIVGRVQGVGFRHAMRRRAAALGIRGWVRNRLDGNVEALVQGDPDAVAVMIAWARHGPRTADVDRVEIEPDDGEFTAFEQRPTE